MAQSQCFNKQTKVIEERHFPSQIKGGRFQGAVPGFWPFEDLLICYFHCSIQSMTQGPTLNLMFGLRYLFRELREGTSGDYGQCLGTQVKFHLPSVSFLMKACPWGKLWVFTLLVMLRDMLNAKSVRL